MMRDDMRKRNARRKIRLLPVTPVSINILSMSPIAQTKTRFLSAAISGISWTTEGHMMATVTNDKHHDKIRTSNWHGSRVYLKMNISPLISASPQLAFMAIIKTYGHLICCPASPRRLLNPFWWNYRKRF
jgi:hypothetical protein